MKQFLTSRIVRANTNFIGVCRSAILAVVSEGGFLYCRCTFFVFLSQTYRLTSTSRHSLPPLKATEFGEITQNGHYVVRSVSPIVQ